MTTRLRSSSPAGSRSGQVVLAIKSKHGERSRSSTPIRNGSYVQRRSPSPAHSSYGYQRTGVESREDRDVVDTESDNFTPSSNGSYQMDDEETIAMDEIIFQRYVNEKRKYKKSEARNLFLLEELSELRQKLEKDATDYEKMRQDQSSQYEEQVKMTEALHKTIRNLQSQFSKQSLEHGDQITSIREEADRHALSIQEDAEQKIASLELSLGDVQSKYDSSQLLLRREMEKNKKLELKQKEVEDESLRRLEMIEVEKGKSSTLASKIQTLQTRFSQTEQISEERLRVVNSELNELGAKLEFESEKADDFSSELKLISCDYVETLELLNCEQKKTEKLENELEQERIELTAQLKENALLSTQLEEMSRGYIDVDEMYTKERTSSELLTEATKCLKSELSTEQERNLKLSEKVTRLSKCLDEKEEFSQKVLSSSKVICDELGATKEELNDKVEELKKSSESHNDLKVANDLLREDIEEQAKIINDISNRLQEVDSDKQELETTLKEERSTTIDSLKKESGKSSSLETKLIHLKGSYEAQSAIIMSTETKLKDYDKNISSLEDELKRSSDKNDLLEKKLEDERQDCMEKLDDGYEEVELLRKENREIEKKYHALFDNLVETEEELKASRDASNTLLEQLETKDEDTLHNSNALREEIHSKEQIIETERFRNEELSKDLQTMNQKHDIMYNNLIAAEERLLEAQDELGLLSERMKQKDENCHQLGILLQKEKHRPHQRKLKVAKKMIRSEKDRYKRLTEDMVAKEVMLRQMKEETDRMQDELQKTRDLLEIEKQHKSSHSARAIQELHRQLDDERKDIKSEKETLRNMLKAEKGNVKSLTIRLKAVEGSLDSEEISKSLAEHHELSENVRILLEEKCKVEDELSKQKEAERDLREQLLGLQKKLEEMVYSMETLTNYCSRLEEEKAILLANGTSLTPTIQDDDTLTLDDNFSIASFDTIQTDYSSSVLKSPTVHKIDEDIET